MWILILYIFSSRGPQLEHIEFKTQTKCMEAMYDFKQKVKKNDYTKVYAICTKK
jgi:hypothetical protein